MRSKPQQALTKSLHDDALPRLVTCRTVPLPGVTLHVVEAGPATGPTLILLHGFPEFWWGWRHQIAPLARAGFHVVVPDQRGYNLSGKPAGTASYALGVLAADVIGLADALGAERFHLVGHDWGGVVAWQVASEHPDRVERLVVLNAPHPGIALGYALRHPGQWLRSTYVGMFQVPWLPEMLLRSRDFRTLTRAMTTTGAPGAFSASDLARYREAWRRPGALTAMLNWYRAMRRRDRPETSRTRVPSFVIWGRRDAFLQPGLAIASIAQCDNARIAWLDDASHWLHHEQPERVADMIIGFLSR